MAICVAVDCKSDTRQENLKQQCLIKIKRRNIQSMQHTTMLSAIP